MQGRAGTNHAYHSELRIMRTLNKVSMPVETKVTFAESIPLQLRGLNLESHSNRKINVFYRFLFVLVIIILSTAWSQAGSASAPPGTPSTAIGEHPPKLAPDLGGPYFIGGAKVPQALDPFVAFDKFVEFINFRNAGWDSSEVANLDGALFSGSVRSNRGSGAPAADHYQRYNYVVQKVHGRLEILVAIWSLRGNPTSNTICGLPGAAPYPGMSVADGQMVNFYPEKSLVTPLGIELNPIPVEDRKCVNVTPTSHYINGAPGSKSNGVLDAHSKHFMLAEGEKIRLADFPAVAAASEGAKLTWRDTAGESWIRQSVEYAGEIVVDVQNCTYLINQGSGTYEPDAKFLPAVAQLFAERVGAAPTYVWNDRTNTLLPTGLISKSALQCK